MECGVGCRCYDYQQRAGSAAYGTWQLASTGATSTTLTVTAKPTASRCGEAEWGDGAVLGRSNSNASRAVRRRVGQRRSGGDCETLLAAKTTLDDKGDQLNWARSRALSEWTGVTVSAGRVVRLGGLALKGQIPASLSKLTQLRHRRQPLGNWRTKCSP